MPVIDGLSLRQLEARKWISICFVFVVGLSVSLLIFGFSYRLERMRLADEFRTVAKDPLDGISERIDRNLSSVRSLVALFESSRFVERQEFSTFASSLLSWNTGVQAFEWLPRVLVHERKSYESRARDDGLKSFLITERGSDGHMVPATSRREFFPVFYLEPMRGNEAALGYDLNSEAARSDALKRARDARQVVASKAVSLVQGAGEEVGVLVVAPVFEPDRLQMKESHSNKPLKGFCLSVLNVRSLVDEGALISGTPAEIQDFFLVAQREGARDEVLWSLHKETRDKPDLIQALERSHATKTLLVGDQTWEIVVSAPKHWPDVSKFWRSWVLLASLLVIAVAATAIYLMRQLGLMEQERLAVSLDEKNRKLESASKELAKYLPPQIWKSTLNDQNPRHIGAKRKPLTIFFGDIVGFTNLSQEIHPDQLTFFLNDFFAEMSDIGERHGATLDKFAGDAVVMFFGDPRSNGSSQDAVSCVEMALEMQQRMAVLRKRWKAQGLKRPLQMRIGIHSGECDVGNFGSEKRMAYTIVGLNVNLAARIEKYGIPGGVTVTRETRSLVNERFECLPFKQVSVRGVDRVVDLFSISGVAWTGEIEH